MKGYISDKCERKIEYQEWINKNVPEDCLHQCRKYADMMAEVFPSLRVVGYVREVDNFQHCWCVDTDGHPVDPTAHQFNEYVCKKYPGDYYLHFPVRDMPGKCPVCGEYEWPNTPTFRKLYYDISSHVRCRKIMEEWMKGVC